MNKTDDSLIRRNFLEYSLFLIAVIFLFFFWTDKIPLWSSDEGRFAEKAREMWATKDFIVPHFNYIPAIEKPVLAYFVTAGSYALFGIHNWSARLPSILSAILGIFLCYGFTQKLLGRRTARMASLLLLTSLGYVLLGRFAMIDMLLTFLLSGALFCLMTACLQEKRNYYFTAYLLMGLAFLTKGLIAILLPALIFFMFLVWTRNFREITKMHLGWGILILILVIAPWWIAISKRHPEFFKVFIVHNHFARFMTPVFGRKRPFWFFIPILFGVAFPWSLFLPAAVINGLKRGAQDRKKIQFLICWIVVIFGFFSLPKSKLPYYLLPLSLPFSILAASFLSDCLNQSSSPKKDWLTPWTWKAVLWVCLLASVGLNLYLFLPFPKRDEVAVLQPFLHLTSLAFLVGSIASYFFYKRGRIGEGILSLAGMIYMGLIMVIAGMRAISPFQSTYDFAQLLKATPAEDIAVYASPDHFSDFIFYLRKRVIIVGNDRGSLADESQKAANAEDTKTWFLDTQHFIQRFNAHGRRMVCLLEEKKLKELQESGLKDYHTLKADHLQLLISNFE